MQSPQKTELLSGFSGFCCMPVAVAARTFSPLASARWNTAVRWRQGRRPCGSDTVQACSSLFTTLTLQQPARPLQRPQSPHFSPSTNQPPSEEMRAEQMRRSSSVKCCTICRRSRRINTITFGTTLSAWGR